MKNKVKGIIIFFVMYFVTYIGSFFLSYQIENVLLRLLAFDVLATIFIWLFSLAIRNSSLYDAYWSLTPMVMIIYLVTLTSGLNLFHYFFIAVFLIWSLRLTINWMITFGGIKWIDWRYRMYKEKNSFLVWQIINFFGIQMMPTIFVFIAFIPTYCVLITSVNAWTLLGIGIMLIGIILEFLADHEMHEFLRNTKERKTCDSGLWKYSRHPNYLGEILIWLGVYLSILVNDISKWYLGCGFIIMLFLFNFISIPLMEKRQIERRSDYRDYQKSTSRLILLPKRIDTSKDKIENYLI